jgi:CheY-like chemotaxis protein
MRTNRKILVVDDDAVVGKSFDRVLSPKGYAVIHANGGADALVKLSSGEYDMVFTDIRMPGMDGLEVTERIKASRPWLPVVIITGYGTEANEEAARKAGVSAFLRKPLSPELIEGCAEKALAERDAAPAAEAPPEKEALVAPAAPPSRLGKAVRAARNVGLFFAAPFVGLAYILAFPLVGLGMMLWFAAKALAKYEVARRAGSVISKAGFIVLAPFIGLAYILVFPFVGLGMLAWIGGRSLLNGRRAE